LAAREHKWSIFYAYTDPDAGEIGIVYQAANWLYLGNGAGCGAKGRWRFFNRRERCWYSEKALTQRKIDLRALRSNPDWIAEKQPNKGRYLHLEADRRERRLLLAALKYPVLPYPKR
jgi:hypothetical protein